MSLLGLVKYKNGLIKGGIALAPSTLPAIIAPFYHFVSEFTGHTACIYVPFVIV